MHTVIQKIGSNNQGYKEELFLDRLNYKMQPIICYQLLNFSSREIHSSH